MTKAVDDEVLSDAQLDEWLAGYDETEQHFKVPRLIRCIKAARRSTDTALPVNEEAVAWRYRDSFSRPGQWDITFDAKEAQALSEAGEGYACEPLFASPPAVQPAVAVTEAMVKRAAYEFLLHRGQTPWQVSKYGTELWEENAPAMRAALAAAIPHSEQLCPVCQRHVMADPQPACGFIATCGRRLTRIEETRLQGCPPAIPGYGKREP